MCKVTRFILFAAFAIATTAPNQAQITEREIRPAVKRSVDLLLTTSVKWS